MSADNVNKLLKDSCIAVVIPTFKVSNQILETIKSIGPEVDHIIVIDDFCPEGSGKMVRTKSVDPRVEVLFHDSNLGVGGAMKTGYQRAKDLRAEIVVKIDGDGQMDSSKIPEIVSHILEGDADYVKGNRFFDIETVRSMPKMRILGNLALSFFAKFSTGYWRIFDPNNGFTAISSTALSRIQLSKIDNRYFFESDMLFRLNLARAVVMDSPMPARYGTERSNLKIRRVLFEFPFKHLRNFMKRVAYNYYLRDFTLASLELPIGVSLTSFGLIFGLLNFEASREINQATAPGTLILISMCVLVGIQLILSFFSYDIDSSPIKPITKKR
jgi:glycosyltransferase involved in cell wall biosynthesis